MNNDVDKPMGNAELRLTLASIESEIVETKGIAIETRVQTTKTNGRVTSLEKSKYVTMGAVGVLSAVVVPILGWALWVLANIQSQVHTAVDAALSSYNIQNGN